MNSSDYLEIVIRHVLSTPTVLQLVLSAWFVFVVVYRFGIQRHLRYKVFTGKFGDSKILNCESCFAFWLCLLISTNLTTAAAAYLLYNFYEGKR